MCLSNHPAVLVAILQELRETTEEFFAELPQVSGKALALEFSQMESLTWRLVPVTTSCPSSRIQEGVAGASATPREGQCP